ncbi:MAG: hypothetical protein HQK52_23470 [Oligoflexia bacterium]|nr:hypothetical protein [Oligoflexia bacterium]
MKKLLKNNFAISLLLVLCSWNLWGTESISNILNYAGDRIYSAGERDGDFKEAVEESIVKLQSLLKDTSYCSSNDLDRERSNPLHLIARAGISDFYNSIKNNDGHFIELLNTQNQKGLYPLDIAKTRIITLNGLFSMILLDKIFVIPFFVTFDFYEPSQENLVTQMLADSAKSAHSTKVNILIYLQNFLDKISSTITNSSQSEKAKEQSKKLLSAMIKRLNDYQGNEEDFHAILKNLIIASLETSELFTLTEVQTNEDWTARKMLEFIMNQE